MRAPRSGPSLRQVGSARVDGPDGSVVAASPFDPAHSVHAVPPVAPGKPVDSVGPVASVKSPGDGRVTPKGLALDVQVVKDKAGDFFEKEVLSNTQLRKALPVRTKSPMGVGDFQASAIVADVSIKASREGTEKASRQLDEILTALGDEAGRTPGGLSTKIKAVAAVDGEFADPFEGFDGSWPW